MAGPFLRLAEADDVAVAVREAAAGSAAEWAGVVAREPIPLGHKMALRAIAAGMRVRKFGVPIGRATRDIAAGELVHMHNLASDYIDNDVDHHEA